MPINIADQFKVNVALPIDSRIVASGSNKDLIQFKYDGLRVFDTTNRLTYIWNATTSTFSVADINGSGQTNYMTRWSSTGLTSSGIYYAVGSSINKGNVGINTVFPATPQAVLQINSDTGASQPFVIHKGASTLLAYNFHSSSGDSFFAVGVGSAAIRFSDNGYIDFLTRKPNLAAINSTSDISLAFRIESTTGASVFPGNNAAKSFLLRDLILSGNATAPSSSLYLRSQNAFSTKDYPDVAWYNDDNTGIFHPAPYQIGFSIQGTQRAKLTSTGLLLGGGTLLNPFNKLHLDNGNGVASYLQFTAGTTTGTGASSGFLVGVNPSGYPILQSFNNFPISTTFGGKHQHKLEPNSFTIYSDPGGVGFNDITGFNGKRVTRVTKAVSRVPSTLQQNILLDGFSVPVSSLCSLEITFVTTLRHAPSPPYQYQYKTQKLLISFSVTFDGIITPQNNGTGVTPPAPGGIASTSGHDIKTLISSSAASIGMGYLVYDNGSSAGAYVRIYQQVGIVLPASLPYSVTTVIDYKLTVNKHGL
jgi:hypothetical protein